MNPRLRTAIQAAKQANMPKENISRAISKSENKNASKNVNRVSRKAMVRGIGRRYLNVLLYLSINDIFN